MASKGSIIFILSDTRSGSTLLDQLLGAHDEIVSLGEIHHLRAYVTEDRSLYDPAHPLVCSCGSRLSECPFWRDVEHRLGRPLDSLVLSLRFIGLLDDDRTRRPLVRRAVKKLLDRGPNAGGNALVSSLLGQRRVVRDSLQLYDAIFEVSRQARYVVDSSKAVFRFRSIFEARPDRVRALALGRDYRGTIHSKMKRGRGLQGSARTWARRMRWIRDFTADLAPNALIRVRYEDLCDDPRAELTRVCEFLDIDFTEAMLTRPLENMHHLGGSPSKFDRSRSEIKPDKSYSGAYSERDLATIKSIVGEMAREWDYD